MSKRWLLFLGIYLACVSSISFGFDLKVQLTPKKSVYVAHEDQSLNVFEFDFSEYFPENARVVRNLASSFARQKADRINDSDSAGLVFLACKLTRSYSELFVDKYLRQLIGKTIQVNAP